MPRSRLRAILEWTVPAPYLRLLRRWRSRNRAFESLLAPNAALRNRHAGDGRCFVIGNGPSLKEQDITRLRGEVCIVANSFFLHPDHTVVAPRYWCVADPHYQAEQPNALAWLRELEAHSDGATLFFNPNAAAVLRKHGLFRNRPVHYISAGLACDAPEDVRLDLTRPINVGLCTVSSFAIPLAIYLGFREIYLIGCDANWHVAGDHTPLHFYATNPHFQHWDTNAASRQTLGLSVEEELASQCACFKSHRLLRDYARHRGIAIVNATRGGYLDVYPRVAYESLYNHDPDPSPVARSA